MQCAKTPVCQSNLEDIDEISSVARPRRHPPYREAKKRRRAASSSRIPPRRSRRRARSSPSGPAPATRAASSSRSKSRPATGSCSANGRAPKCKIDGEDLLIMKETDVMGVDRRPTAAQEGRLTPLIRYQPRSGSNHGRQRRKLLIRRPRQDAARRRYPRTTR